MHTLLLVLVTSGLVLHQTTQGLTAIVDPDAEFIEEATADGFIVHTEGPNKTDKPQDNYSGTVTHDLLNPEANLSLSQKDSLPTVTIAKTPEANRELTDNANELPKNESATVLIAAGLSTSSPEENAEGSGIFAERGIEVHTSLIRTRVQTAAEVDISSDGSGMYSETLNEKQGEDVPFTTTVRYSGDLDTSTPTFLLSEENESETGPKFPTSDWLTTMSTTITEEEAEIAVQENYKLAVERPMNESSPDPVSAQPKSSPSIPSGDDLQPTISALVKNSTPDWLLILALCLTVGAVICVFVGIGTKDIWYGPARQCLNINSTGSKKHEVYDKVATLPLSEKEKMVLMVSQQEEKKETDCTIISLEDAPEKEYLM